MAHGTPDYGVTAGQATVYQLTDLGELAARLGSPITHDRRGDVLWWDDFECGMAKYAFSLIGANANATLSTTLARNGRRSLLLRPGDAVGNSAQARHDQPFPRVSRIGEEYSFNLGGNNLQMIWRLLLYDGVNVSDFRVRFDSAATTLEYWGSAGAYVSFATGVSLKVAAVVFHTGKLVVNPAGGQYERFILNSVEYSLSGVAGQIAASATDPLLEAYVQVVTQAVTPIGAYIDDPVLTQNEPANP